MESTLRSRGFQGALSLSVRYLFGNGSLDLLAERQLISSRNLFTIETTIDNISSEFNRLLMNFNRDQGFGKKARYEFNSICTGYCPTVLWFAGMAKATFMTFSYWYLSSFPFTCFYDCTTICAMRSPWWMTVWQELVKWSWFLRPGNRRRSILPRLCSNRLILTVKTATKGLICYSVIFGRFNK